MDFTLRDGGHVRVGTPEPAALCSAVAARVSPSSSSKATRVPLDQIRGVSLVNQLPAIERKVNGFAAAGKLRGRASAR